MKTYAIAAGAAVLAAAVFGVDFAYVGADRCAKMCHRAKAKGGQYAIWQKSKHAAAYATLATPAARETAKKAGVPGDPQKSEKCLTCHVTGYGVGTAWKAPGLTEKEGVSCEACHGPGSKYMKRGTMTDRKRAIAAGLVEQDEAVCTRCHNQGSPNYQPFMYSESKKKIAHPSPFTGTVKGPE